MKKILITIAALLSFSAHALEVTDDIRYDTKAIANLATGGVIGTAATTVDVLASFNLSQSTAGQTVTLPNPTDARANKVVLLTNVGAVPFIAYGVTVQPSQSTQVVWSGAAWKGAAAMPTPSLSHWFSAVGATTLPDGTADLTENIRRNGLVGLNADPNTTLHVNSTTANDTGLRLEQAKQGATQSVASITSVAVGVDTTGKVVVTNATGSADTRAVDSQPQAYQNGAYNEFKQASVIGMGAITPATGTYVGLRTFRRYGLNGDFSGGQVRQEATTDDGRTYWRMSTSATAWGAWKQILSVGDVNTASVSGASASSPAAGFHYDAIVSYQGNGNFTTQTINTNIPANTAIMPTINLHGYVYGTGDTLDIQIGLYTYSAPANSIISAVWQSKGTKSPTAIRAGFTAAGMLTLEITWPAAGGEYFNRYEVSAYNDGNGAHQASWFQNWAVASAAFPVTVTNIVTVTQKSNNRFFSVPNYASAAVANADANLLAGTIYTVTVGVAKQLHIK
jgi:hypothetical protein